MILTLSGTLRGNHTSLDPMGSSVEEGEQGDFGGDFSGDSKIEYLWDT